MWWVKAVAGFARVLVFNLTPFFTVIFRSRTSLIAENLVFAKAAGLLMGDNQKSTTGKNA
jgi:hypothetical protein